MPLELTQSHTQQIRKIEQNAAEQGLSDQQIKKQKDVL